MSKFEGEIAALREEVGRLSKLLEGLGRDVGLCSCEQKLQRDKLENTASEQLKRLASLLPSTEKEEDDSWESETTVQKWMTHLTSILLDTVASHPTSSRSDSACGSRSSAMYLTSKATGDSIIPVFSSSESTAAECGSPGGGSESPLPMPEYGAFSLPGQTTDGFGMPFRSSTSRPTRKSDSIRGQELLAELQRNGGFFDDEPPCSQGCFPPPGQHQGFYPPGPFGLPPNVACVPATMSAGGDFRESAQNWCPGPGAPAGAFDHQGFPCGPSPVPWTSTAFGSRPYPAYHPAEVCQHEVQGQALRHDGAHDGLASGCFGRDKSSSRLTQEPDTSASSHVAPARGSSISSAATPKTTLGWSWSWSTDFVQGTLELMGLTTQREKSDVAPEIVGEATFLQEMPSGDRPLPWKDEWDANPRELHGLRLGRGTWAWCFHSARGQDRAALTLIFQQGIITPTELADDLTRIPKDHVRDMLQIGGELLSMKENGQAVTKAQAKEYADHRLKEIFEQKIPRCFQDY